MVKWIESVFHDEAVSLIGTIFVVLFLAISILVQESITKFTDKLFRKKD